MQIKYIGPKAVISQHGISFKDGKDDKFVYINNAIQIFKAINHEYQKNKLYHHDIEQNNYTSDDIFTALKTQVTGFEENFKKELQDYYKALDSQEEEIDSKVSLSKDEKLAFKNNLKIMREYRTQRFINKLIYEHIIKAITDKMFENKLREITTPFNERYWHILQTIQGWLSHDYKINTRLDTISDEDNIIIILHLNNMY